MNIKKLRLKNYRNYDHYEIEPHDGLNVIIGRNAAGKTNLLESIYFLENEKSHRTNVNQELIRWNEDFLILKALIKRSDRDIEIEATITKEGGKNLKINGVETKKSQNKRKPLLTVLFTPDHLKIVKEMPEHRRAYLDEILEKVRPDYAYWRQQYQKILKQRNMLLKKVFMGHMKADIIDYWDKQIIGAGVKIITGRKNIIEKLDGQAREAYKKITHENVNFTLFYENQLLKEGYDNNTLEEGYEIELKKKRKIEIERGQSLVGPHRDDVGIYIAGIDSRSYGSQGEQRSAALALKMAELVIISSTTKETPVLLLDDVMSELDKERRKALLRMVEKGIQTIITSTSADFINESNISQANVIEVK